MRAPLESCPTPFAAPSGATEELTAAIEAATGLEQEIVWTDPMDGADVKMAFDRLLMAKKPERGLDVLAYCGMMEALLPEVAAMVGFGEGIRHKDVWSHTKIVVLRSPLRLDVRWAALLHDIGKVPTRRFTPDGSVTFLGHPDVGARMFTNIANRLGLKGPSMTRIRFLIASHLRASSYQENWTDSAVRRFAKDMGDALEDLLDLSRADITSKYPEKVRRGTMQINMLAERVARLRALDAKPKPLPKGLGTAIMEHFDIPPGPRLGDLMRHLTDEVEAGRLSIQEEYGHYLEFLEQNRSLLD